MINTARSQENVTCDKRDQNGSERSLILNYQILAHSMKEKVCKLREINSYFCFVVLYLFICFFFLTDSFAGIAPGGRPVLSFVVGDEVELINKNDPEWWEVSSCTFIFFKI